MMVNHVDVFPSLRCPLGKPERIGADHLKNCTVLDHQDDDDSQLFNEVHHYLSTPRLTVQQDKEELERDAKYRSVMKCLIRRYVTTQQRKAEETGITEDDINEVKQAVTSFRSELFDILRTNGMKGVVSASEVLSRKERLRERRLLKDFNIDLVETVVEAFMKDAERKSKFSLIRRLTTGKRENAKKNWNTIVGAARSKQNPIGKTAAHSGSLKELREKVLQEQESAPVRGVERFVQAAKRVVKDQANKRQFDNTSNIASIEEEIPGTFSSGTTPRNSVPQDVPDEHGRKNSLNDFNQFQARTVPDTQKNIIINVELKEDQLKVKEGQLLKNSNRGKQNSKVQGLISTFDPDRFEDEAPKDSPRRHSAPASDGTDGRNLSQYLSQRRNARHFTTLDESVGWL
ncbi:hypothetical protein TNCV_4438551 [Trichonephila clavipes]|nr:hypothetical protein TNCV_4438551 [Trichonephila clavipes]